MPPPKSEPPTIDAPANRDFPGGRPPPLAPSDAAPPSPALEPVLRDRMAAHLEAFDRRAPMLPPGEGVPARSKLRPASVALVLVDDGNGSASFILTLRASKLRRHGGQFALPGGRRDPGEDTIEAALRELREEVGLDLDGADVLGTLDDYPTRSGFLMTPVVVWAGPDAVLEADPSEVAKIYRIPLGELEKPDVPALWTIPESERLCIGIPLVGAMINAPTAAVIYQFREVCMHGRHTRVDHYEQAVFAWK